MSEYLPRFFDYSPELPRNFVADIENANKLKGDKIEAAIRRSVLWKLHPEEYSAGKLTEAAKEWGLTTSEAKSAVTLVLFLMKEYYQVRMEKQTISEEATKAGLSKEFVDNFFTIVSQYQENLEKEFEAINSYAPIFTRLFWRIDIKLADTKRAEPPDLRAFVDLELSKPDGDLERVQFEVREKDLRALTKSLNELLSEAERFKSTIEDVRTKALAEKVNESARTRRK